MIKFSNLRKAGVWPLAMVPLLLLILSRVFVHMAGSFVDDPDYAYLLNGLEVLTIYPPSFISHPGTSLIMLVAVVNFGTWLVTLPFHQLGLVTDVLSKSQFYLSANNAILVMAIAAAAFWFADCVRRASGSVTAALAGQASLLLSVPAMIALSHVSPEPLLLAATLVLAGLLAPLAFGKTENARRTATAVGVVLGFSIATKITALPLLPLLLLLPGWDLRKRAGLFAVGGVIVFTLPAAHHYPQMLSWFTGMATHSGSYSNGPAGLPSTAILVSNMSYLFRQAPELFIALAGYAGLSVFGPRSLQRLMAVSALVVAAQILMVLKQPEPRYLVPVVAIFALANAGIVATCGAAWRVPVWALMLAALCNNAAITAAWARTNQASDLANRKIMEQASASGCSVVSYYEAPSEIYKLDFGNQYAGSRFRARLQLLYPKGFTYDWARHSFMHFGTEISVAEIRTRLAPARCIYLMGSPQERFAVGFPFGIPASALTLVARSQFGNSQSSLAVYLYRP